MGCERDAAHVSTRPTAPWNPARRTPRWLAAAPQRPRRPFPQATAPAGAPPSPSPRGPPLWNLRPASASPAQAQRSAALATPFAGTLSHRAARPVASLCLILASHVGIPLSVPIRGSAADPALTGLGEEG